MSESKKVVVTKLKLDTLADAINAKADSSGAKTIDELVKTVNGIRVKDIWLQGGYLKKPPTKTTYNPGEPIATTGMVVTIAYSNGATKDITSGFTISPETAVVGYEYVIIEYKEGDTTAFITLNIVVNSPITIGKNYVSNLNVADTTVRGIAFAENNYLMIGTDAKYNMYRMWMTQNTSGESHRVKANATGTYPVADLAYSNGFIAVPMTTTYGGTLYKNRYLASWNSVDEFINSSSQVSFKIQAHASIKTANRAVAGNNGDVFIGGQYNNSGAFIRIHASSAPTIRYYSSLTPVIDLAYGDGILFMITDGNRIAWIPSPTTDATMYRGPFVDGTVVKCAPLGRSIAVIARTTSDYRLDIYETSDNNTKIRLIVDMQISSNTSDQIVGVNRIGNYLAIIGIDGENNGFIFVVDLNAYRGQKYMLGLKPLLTCQSGNGIGVLNNAGGKYAIARLSI